MTVEIHDLRSKITIAFLLFFTFTVGSLANESPGDGIFSLGKISFESSGDHKQIPKGTVMSLAQDSKGFI